MPPKHPPSQQPHPARWQHILKALTLLALTLAAYWPAVHAGYIWDDDDYVTENRTLLSADGLRQIWFQPGATPQYYPMVHTTFWIEYRLWKLNPLGYHFVNILLHAIGATFLWRVLLRLQLPGAFLAALIFALHPVQVESAAWITERKNVLSGVFYFAAALAYLRFVARQDAVRTQSRSIRRATSALPYYCVALLLFACALLSKTVTCSLPAALLLVFWWRKGRVSGADVWPLTPLFLIGAGLAWNTAQMEKHTVGAVGAEWALSFLDRCLIAGRALWFYVGKLLWPAKLAFIYPRWEINPADWWQWLYPVIAIAVGVALWGLRHKLGRGPTTAALMFAVTLFPALGFVNFYPMRYSFVADHFQYLACVGPIALAAAALTLWSSRFSMRPARLTLTLHAIPLSLAFVTWQQTHIYRDLETLWQDTIAKNPSCWMAYNNLGEVYRKQNKFALADDCYRKALKFKPHYAEALNNLGYSLFARGQFADAEKCYRAALEADPQFAPAWSNLGAAMIGLGREEEALDCLHKALNLNPNSLEAMNNLGVAFAAKDRNAEAAAMFQTLLQFEPRNADTHINLGNALLNLRKSGEAVAHFQTAVEIEPDNAKAHADLGRALAEQENTTKAIEHYARAVALAPKDPNAHYNLGVLLAGAGRTADAIEQFKAALGLKPDYAEAHNNLGVALTVSGQTTGALEHFNAALRAKPDYAEAHNNLAYVLIQLRRSDEARSHLKEALRIQPDYEQAQRQLNALETR